MSLRRILSTVSAGDFIDRYYLQLPLAEAGSAAALAPLTSWETVSGILDQENADVLIARQGVLHPGPRPTPAQARTLYDEGYTLVVRHAERHDARLAELAAGFAADFAAPVNIHIYLTPSGQQGFGWHYDAEDVFIVQTEGAKEYSLRKNTVFPWPLEETLQPDLGFQHELMPLMKCELKAGDWLYIPNGYWHVAQSKVAAASLAIGVMSPAAIDVLDALRERLPRALEWRQRLPCGGALATSSEDELVAHYRQVFSMLGRNLAEQLTDEKLLRTMIRESRERSTPNHKSTP